MWLRFLMFMFLLAAGAGTGWWLAARPGAELGLLAGAVAWWAVDTLRGLRLLRWMRVGDLATVPRLRGLWGEAGDRVRRLLRLQMQRAGRCRAPPAGLPGGDPGLAQRRAAARRPGPHRVVQPDGGRAFRHRQRARPPAAHRQPGARPGIRRLPGPARAHARRCRADGAQRPRRPAAPPGRAPASLWRRPPAAAVHRHHGPGAGRDHAPRFRGQCLARDPHAADGADRLHRNPAVAAAGAGGARALPGADGAAGGAHAVAGQRPADLVAHRGQPAARHRRMDAGGGPAAQLRAGGRGPCRPC